MKIKKDTVVSFRYHLSDSEGVALGHSGRSIDVARTIAFAFVAMNIAALVRVFGTAWASGAYAIWVDLAAFLWVLGFALFAWSYTPILLRPRVDGKPG